MNKQQQRVWYVYRDDRLYSTERALSAAGAIKAAADLWGIDPNSLTASTTIRSKAANEQQPA